jgi:prepilin-type N-terminal cleavage/methylation domain-containing protein
MKSPISDLQFPLEKREGGRWRASIADRRSQIANLAGFTLIEVMVAISLLSLIVIALMAVFNSTQAAFRASVTQTDVLESGRAAMDLIAGDLRALAPSLGYSNVAQVNYRGPVNFCVATNYYNNPPLVQNLTASSSTRTNVQQDMFILSRGNQNGVPTWYGTGYAVYLSPSNTYSLYRFSAHRPVAQSLSASNLFYTDFFNFINRPNSGNYSHLLDGVVGFRVKTYDANGALIVTNQINITTNAVPFFFPCLAFYSNALPGSVEIELATLEDRTLLRADSRPGDLPALPPGDSRTQYLEGQASKVHVFRQRVAIPNVDPSVYP